ncbi:hypothetical protein BH11PSE4_BH11PSE4_29990 [soil metagenome]
MQHTPGASAPRDRESVCGLFDIQIGIPCGAMTPMVSLPPRLRGGEGRPTETMRSIVEVEAGVGGPT